jgi:hypothetical protein
MASFSDWRSKRRKLRERPGTFFALDIVWLVALGVLAFGLASRWSLLKGIHDPFGGVVPFVVPWAGALGGLAISLVGISDHAHDWNGPRFAFWHLVRPIIGLIFGTVAVLIVVLVLTTVHTDQNASGHYPPSGAAILAVISFVVGYREATFRALVTRVVDTIVGPAGVGGAATLALVPSIIDFKQVAAGTTGSATAHLFNGSSDTVNVTPASINSADPQVTVTPFPAQDLKPNESLELNFQWAVPAAGPPDLATTVVITVANTSIVGYVRGTRGPAQ